MPQILAQPFPVVQEARSDKYSTLCFAIIRFSVRSVFNYMFSIAYGSYGTHHASAARNQYLDSEIWLANTTCAVCNYLLRDTGVGVDIIIAAKATYVEAMENFVSGPINVAEQLSRLLFAPPAWTLLITAVVVLVTSYWAPFGCMLRAIDGCNRKVRVRQIRKE